MKIDLDELERKARAGLSTWWIAGRDTRLVISEGGRTGSAGLHLGPSNVDHIAANGPPVTLALIARIRELEAFAYRLLREHEREPVDEAALQALLGKGAVLP